MILPLKFNEVTAYHVYCMKWHCTVKKYLLISHIQYYYFLLAHSSPIPWHSIYEQCMKPNHETGSGLLYFIRATAILRLQYAFYIVLEIDLSLTGQKCPANLQSFARYLNSHQTFHYKLSGSYQTSSWTFFVGHCPWFTLARQFVRWDQTSLANSTYSAFTGQEKAPGLLFIM